jgi:hypothetical protein
MLRWIVAVLCAFFLTPSAKADPACLYQSRSYSEGAFICVQKSLMLTCSLDGAHAAWKVVADNNLSDRCTKPIALSVPSSRAHPRRHLHWTRAAHHPAQPVADASKCFDFNGKRYCE